MPLGEIRGALIVKDRPKLYKRLSVLVLRILHGMIALVVHLIDANLDCTIDVRGMHALLTLVRDSCNP